MNEPKGKISFIDMENWLSYYKIRHSIVANTKTRVITILIRMTSFNTLVVKCDAHVIKPDQVFVESIMIVGNNLNYYEVLERYQNEPGSQVHDYGMTKGYVNSASCFFACALCTALAI